MILWDSEDAAQATGGKNTLSWSATGVSIDTRTIQPGDLFIALKADRDGHEFVNNAFYKIQITFGEKNPSSFEDP